MLDVNGSGELECELLRELLIIFVFDAVSQLSPSVDALPPDTIRMPEFAQSSRINNTHAG